MDIKILLGLPLLAILFFFGIVFAFATDYYPVSLAVSGVLFVAGFGAIAVLYIFAKKPSKIVQRVEFSGEMKAVPIRCPNCGASIEPHKIRIIDGVPYATCGYCGNTVEVTEEPKW